MNDAGLYPAKHQWRDSVQESLHSYAYPASEKQVFFLAERWKKKEKLWIFPGVTLLFAGGVVGLHKDLVSSKAKMSIGNLPVLSKV